MSTIRKAFTRPVTSPVSYATETDVTLWGMIDGVLMLEVKKSTGCTHTVTGDLVERMTEIALRGLAAPPAGRP